ncbi:sensor histidine kinase [Mucilaginibacter sp. SP1R1]|uniref:sensor histidine kinase n=1 Tax=Mucilaginibacter sp. SP1R1 TaxID=2723091 RepID=UPI00160714BF|nr:ATP-binding protein [Mucilaginibacter sp. SP1R1]MBB6148788.1 signal transduction histidine kinase [Mucilaginibacter sp. SP1R1]
MGQGNSDIRLLLVVGVAAMLLLFVSFLLAFIFTQRKKLNYQKSLRLLQERQQNQLIEAAVRSEETERHRIAEELHDEVGALLASSKLHFNSIKINSIDDYNQGLSNKGKELLDAAINKVRGISHNLHSSILQEFGLNEAIKHFTASIGHEAVMMVTTTLDERYTTKDPQNDISIYRIIQEVINNTIKHAHASNINIKSVYADQLLRLTISHNGQGLTQPLFEELRYQSAGLGLKNIQNRVILLRGNLIFGQDASGFNIDIYIPRN